jgi:dihydrofolate reductase
MTKVIIDLQMSLDGFINAPDGGDGGLHNWYFAEYDDPNHPNPKIIQQTIDDLGSIIMGRNTFGTGEDNEGFEEGNNPYTAVNVVVTHNPPAKQPKGMIFADSIESGVKQAIEAAGERDVAIGGGADVSQQALKAGLVDELMIHLIPVLLGGGKRLFEHLGTEPIALEQIEIIDGGTVTHLRYRVVK